MDNIIELRKELQTEFTRLKNEILKGEIGAATIRASNALASHAAKILGSVALQIEYGKLTGKIPNIKFMDNIKYLEYDKGE